LNVVSRRFLLHDSLACEHLLIDFEVITPQDNAIRRRDVPSAKEHNISDNKIKGRNFVRLAISQHSDLNVVLFSIQLAELFLFLIIINSSDHHNNKDREKDGNTLQPTISTPLHENCDKQREYRCA